MVIANLHDEFWKVQLKRDVQKMAEREKKRSIDKTCSLRTNTQSTGKNRLEIIRKQPTTP